jgi:hypothetical protein
VINRTTNRITAARSLDVVPLIVAAMPPLAPAATAIPIRIVGSRNGQFAAASRVVLGPGVTVRTMTVESATSIVATVDVAPSAPIGPRDVVVVSPKQRAVAIGAVSVDR